MRSTRRRVRAAIQILRLIWMSGEAVVHALFATRVAIDHPLFHVIVLVFG